MIKIVQMEYSHLVLLDVDGVTHFLVYINLIYFCVQLMHKLNTAWTMRYHKLDTCRLLAMDVNYIISSRCRKPSVWRFYMSHLYLLRIQTICSVWMSQRLATAHFARWVEMFNILMTISVPRRAVEVFLEMLWNSRKQTCWVERRWLWSGNKRITLARAVDARLEQRTRLLPRSFPENRLDSGWSSMAEWYPLIAEHVAGVRLLLICYDTSKHSV